MVLITFHLPLLRHCVLVSRQSIILSNSLRVLFLSIETVRLPSFEELLNFPQIACSWAFSMFVLISARTCRYFQNNIQVCFSYICWKQFCKPFFDQLKTAWFYLIEKIWFQLYIQKSRYLNTNNNVWHQQRPALGWNEQDRCRQTAKVIMSGILHQKAFVSIPFTTQISSFKKMINIFCHFIYFR